jgi:hypothetical protein
MIQKGNSIPADKSGQFDNDAAVRMIGKIIGFLRNFMAETLTKKNRQPCSYSGWCTE